MSFLNNLSKIQKQIIISVIFVMIVIMVGAVIQETKSLFTFYQYWRTEKADADVLAFASTPPNIVVIMTDDQDAASMNASGVMTRVQQKLVQNGIVLPNTFASYSLCCPSRATFFTGQYAHNHGVMGNAPQFGGGYAKLNHSSTTLPMWLQAGGYYTGHVGKYLNGYGKEDSNTVLGIPPTEIPPGWNQWYGLLDPTTYSAYNYKINQNGTVVTYGTGSANYQTDVLKQKALSFLQNRSGSSQPFFLSFAVTSPLLSQPAPRHVGKFQSAILSIKPSFNESDVTDKPAFIKNTPLFSGTTQSNITKLYRNRLESLLAVDEAVGAIINKLELTGKLANTVIIFVSDNGFLQGEHRVEKGKVLLYEESIKVPFVIRGPGIPAGQTRDQLVANVDLAPTILELAGIAIPSNVTMDGVSIVPVINNPSSVWRNEVLLETTNTPESPLSAPGYFGLRTSQYVYGEYETGEQELYELSSDPYQLNSQHSNPAYQSILTNLQQRLQTLKTCVGVNCW